MIGNTKLAMRQRVARSSHALREGFTMTLYMSVVMLSSQVADEYNRTPIDSIRVLVGTAVGILLVHILAFHVASQLFDGSDHGGSGDPDDAEHEDHTASIAALIMATAAVVALAVSPYVVFSVYVAFVVSLSVLCLILGCSAFMVAGAGGAGLGRSLWFGATIMAIGLLIALVKAAISY